MGRWGRSITVLVLEALAVACATVVLAPASPASADVNPGTQFSPVTSSVLTKPTAVRGTDGRYHFAYELVLTNVTPTGVEISRLEIRDRRTKRSLATLSDSTLSDTMNPLAGLPPGAPPSAARTIDASGGSIVWLDVSVARRAELPRALEHRVALSSAPPGAEPYSFSGVIGRFRTGRRAPIALAPPVEKGIWVADEGCCTAPTHHRRGLVGVDGLLGVAQRFAIDWFLLDREHRAWVGDPSRLDSYYSYRQPLLAAARGKVVNLKDGVPDTAPQGPLGPLPPFDETVGNHVTLKVRGGLYLLYGHMVPGSVRVREGERVRRGEVLGRLGNSGNSSTPHLHFQVQTTPTFFPTDSVPYRFKRFRLLGQITEPFTDEDLALHPTGALEFAPAARPGPRRRELPLDRTVVKFGS